MPRQPRTVPFPYPGSLDGPTQMELAKNAQYTMDEIGGLDLRMQFREDAAQWMRVQSDPNYFTNSWVNYGTAWWGEAAYRRLGDIVEVRGLVRAGTATTSPFTLPEGFRPLFDHIYPTSVGAANVHGRIDVLNTGAMTIRLGAGGTNAFATLHHIRFTLSDLGENGWLAVDGGIGFTNSWANFGGTWEWPSYRLVDDEWVELQGLAGGGSSGTSMFTLPPGLRPPYDIRFPADVASVAYGRVDIGTDGTVVGTGSGTYVSLGGIRYSLSQPGTNGWTRLELEGAWTNTDDDFPLEYRVRGDVVEVRGEVDGGTGTIAVLPRGAQPYRNHLISVDATGAKGRIGVYPQGNITLDGGTATTVSLNNVRFSTLPA